MLLGFAGLAFAFRESRRKVSFGSTMLWSDERRELQDGRGVVFVVVQFRPKAGRFCAAPR